MSQALRDAIASVRRVSRHEMEELPPPRSDQAPYEQPPFDDDPPHEQASERGGTDEWSSLDEYVVREERPFDDATADERFDRRALREEPPFAAPVADARQWFDHAAAGDEQHAFGRGGTDERGSVDEYPWHADPSFDDGAEAPPSFGDRRPREQSSFDVPKAGEQPRFGDDAAEAPPSFGDRRPREKSSFDVPEADEQPRFGDDAADEQPLFDHGGQEHWGYRPRRESPDRPPLWRGVTQRRSLHFAAFAVATMFVLLAGFGLGILSGAQEFDRLVATLGWTPLADKTVGATQTDPAPSSADPARTSGAGGARPAEPETSRQLSELETVEVAPLPAPPRVEQSPGPTANDMPLPPPPKPALQSSLSGEGPPASDRIDGVVDDAVDAAAVALLEADGAGGPFEPILVKTTASGPRVFVHYTESAPGSPATALHLVRHLKAAGFAVEGRAVEFPIPKSSIRYFFDTDRDEAEAVSAQLDGQVPGEAAVPILDFTSYEPKPREGHLEVWLGR